MKSQDKILLDASSNGSLTKYRTAEKVWQLITDLPESTQHARQRNNHPRAINEVSSSGETAALTKTLGEITNILKICSCYPHYTDECPSLQEDNTLAATNAFYNRPNQGYHQQGGNYNQGGNYSQGWQDNSNQGWRVNYNQGGRDNGGNQRWNNNNQQNRYQQNPPYQHQNQGRAYQTYQPPHQRQAPQLNQPQVPQITYPHSSSNQDETLRSILQGQREFQASLNSSINGLTSTIQALLSHMEPTSTSNVQPSSPSALPSQPLPNPKSGTNVITLRSGTKLQERGTDEPSSRDVAQDEDVVERFIKDIEEVDEVQEVVEEVIAQPKSGVLKDENVLQEATPIPFPTLIRKTKKQVELDPKMVEIFKKVEVTILLFDAIRQVPNYAKFLKDLYMNKEKIHELETIALGSSISALMGDIPEKCGDPGPCLVTCTIDGI
nr:GATA zinc finger domain-containing protein 14-like [Arachis hypogaea]